MKYGMVVAMLSTLFMTGESYANVASDLKLARKFAPILILTEETGGKWGDIRVTKPEPVEIVGADSLSNLYFTAKVLDQRTRIASDTLGINWHPRIDKDQVERNCNVNFSMNRFALLDANCNVYGSRNGNEIVYQGVWSRCQTTKCGLPKIHVQGPIFPEFFDYPGVNPTEWNSTYFGTGSKAGHNFANTAYVHVYKTTHSVYADSITVIQYFYFYPYNHWWNRHEGDWQRVHVVVSSRNPDTAHAIGVEYLAHEGHISYYNDYPFKYDLLGQPVDRTDKYYPDLTSQFVFNPQIDLKLSQGTHPIVYVGAGSHAALPTGGRVRIHDAAVTFAKYESMTHTGLVLSTHAGDSHSNLWERYDLVLLPEPDATQTSNNMGLPDSLSWLGADVLWGTPKVRSPDSVVLGVPRGNDSPRGPYHKGWKSPKFFNLSSTGGSPLTHAFTHSEFSNSYHHWAILGQETWSGTVTPLTGDIVIFPGATLTVDAGSVIEFEHRKDRHRFHGQGHGTGNRTEIFVYGTLKAEGTAADSIYFQRSGNTRSISSWGGIRVMKGGSVDLDHTGLHSFGGRIYSRWICGNSKLDSLVKTPLSQTGIF